MNIMSYLVQVAHGHHHVQLLGNVGQGIFLRASGLQCQGDLGQIILIQFFELACAGDIVANKVSGGWVRDGPTEKPDGKETSVISTTMLQIRCCIDLQAALLKNEKFS